VQRPDGDGRGGVKALLAPLAERYSRRTLSVAAAVIAVLVLVGAVLATANGGIGDGGAGDKPGASAGTAKDDKAEDDKAQDGKAKDEGADEESGKSTPSASATPSSSEDAKAPSKDAGKGGGEDGAKPGGAKLPAGFKNVTDNRFHFGMALPDGWSRTGVAGANSGARYGASAGSLPKIQVDHNGSPTSDAAEAWRQLEPSVRGNSSGYHLIGINKIDWRGYPTVADWKFTREENGEKVRVLNRGFKVDGSHGYAIMITCKASEWDGKKCRQLRETAFRTFKPVG
jgi:hypothetical protein